MSEIKKEFKTKLEEFKEKQEAEYKALKEQLEAQTKIEEQLDSVLKTENEDNLKIVMDVLSPTILDNIDLFQDEVKLELSNKLSSFIAQNFEKMNDEFKNSIKNIFRVDAIKKPKSDKPRAATFYILDGASIKDDFENLYEMFQVESIKFFEEENKFLVKKKPYSSETKDAVISNGFEDVIAFFDKYSERMLKTTSDKEGEVLKMSVKDFEMV